MPGVAITAITVANPTVVTSAAHGLQNGHVVKLAGTNSTPNLDGDQVATIIDANTFTVPVNVTVAGTAGMMQRCWYVDYVGGNDANTGRNFAQRHLTASQASLVARAGDEIRVMGSPDPTSLGQSATWTNLSKVVLLTTAVTANICDCESAWTQSTNVTATADTADFKEGTHSAKLVILAAFTTGLLAYFPLGSSVNLSAYKQVSFWIKLGLSVTAGQVSLRLCSDTAGVTTVNTIPIPANGVASQWLPVTVDLGAALGSAIQSIALYQDVDLGAMTIFIDNIIACKDSTAADSLSLVSLIGKNSGNDGWYGIQSIVGTTVKLDNAVTTLGNAGSGYSGTTATLTTYKRECIRHLPANFYYQSISKGGVLGNLIYFEGGWDRTAMTSVTGQTWTTGSVGQGQAFVFPSAAGYSYFSVNNFGACRYGNAFQFIAGATYYFGIVLSNLTAVNCSPTSISMSGICDSVFTNLLALNGTGTGFSIVVCYRNVISLKSCNHLGAVSGLSLGGAFNQVTMEARNNGAYALVQSGVNNTILNLVSSGNVVGAVQSGLAMTLINASMAEATKLSWTSDQVDVRMVSLNEGGTADNHLIYTDNALIQSDATTRHTASGISWKLMPLTAVRSVGYPLRFTLAAVAVNASALVTASVWVNRTNTGIAALLVARANLMGLAADVSSAVAVATASTWEQLTLTFTPTGTGVVEFEVWCYGGTTYAVYVDDFGIAQA